jgi:hypothetical protein
MTKAEQEKTGLKGDDKSQSNLQNAPDTELPEGLQRERKGPLDENLGRGEKDDLGFPKNDESKFG